MQYDPKGGIVTRGGTDVSRSIVQRAEALLRSLIGVAQAEVRVRPTGGVEQVRLVSDGGLSNGQIVQNVRSALLAALGVALQPNQIEFVGAAAFPVSPSDPAISIPDEPAVPSPQATAAIAEGPMETVAQPSADRAVSSKGANGGGSQHVAGPGERTGGNGSGGIGAGKHNGHGNGGGSQQVNGREHAVGVPPDHLPETRTASRPARQISGRFWPGRPAPEQNVNAVTRPEGTCTIGAREVCVVRVETLRQAGRLRCRVVLSAGPDQYSAVADCADHPLAELNLAGRLTCDALRAGDLTQLHFDGATVANLAGGMHVLVALNGWNRGEPVCRSGSAVIRDSAEQAAALAVLHAIANT